jgi:16S rRNA (guanine527-N7)-methyltransferase
METDLNTVEIIRNYFPTLDEKTILSLENLGSLSKEWNDKINTISRKDIDNIFSHHILHSLSIFKFMSFSSGSRILDIGTGGGYPGLPLAIVNPETEFVLCDSIGKKIKVVQAIVEALKLDNVTAVNDRAEKLGNHFDFVTGRAVTALSDFMKYAQPRIQQKNQKNVLPNGVLYLKGGSNDEELKPYKKRMELVKLHSYFKLDFYESKELLYIQA